MTAVRKFVAGMLLAVASLTASASTAEAGNGYTCYYPATTANYRIYYVYYRSCPHSPWVCYGGYYYSNQAAYAANYFRAYGYDTYVR